MNIEQIKIEPNFEQLESEDGLFEETVMTKIEKKEGQDILDVTYECYEKKELNFPVECDPGEGSREVSNKIKTEIDDNEMELSSVLHCDSFKITYMNEGEHDYEPSQTCKSESLDHIIDEEEITIIGCDPVDLPIVETDPDEKIPGRLVPEIVWYKCGVCQFKTSKKVVFNKHVKGHVGVEKIKMANCHLCTFKTIYPNNLKKHLLRHNSTSEFKCNLCSYTASLRAALHDHMKNVHLKKHINQSRLYRCSDCEYKTKYVSNFKRHSKSCHEKSLKCRLCDFKTIFKHKFVEHSLSHDEVEDTSLELIPDAIYQCELCKYETIKPDNLINHNKTSHPLETNDNVTVSKSKLNQQFKVIQTNNLKVFKCQECGHSTTDQSNFNRHLKSHVKNDTVPLFECYTCGLKTKYKLNLVKHVKKHKLVDKQK